MRKDLQKRLIKVAKVIEKIAANEATLRKRYKAAQQAFEQAKEKLEQAKSDLLDAIIRSSFGKKK